MKVRVTDAMKKRAQRMRKTAPGAGSYKHTGANTISNKSSRGHGYKPMNETAAKKAKKRRKIDDVGDARIVWHKKRKRSGEAY
jgi:hypothetical protein